MKKIYLIFASLLCGVIFETSALATASVFTQAALQSKVVYTDPNQPVKSNHGKIILTLKSNPTTGYAGYFDASHSDAGIQTISHQYVAPNNGMIGAPGYEIWTFQLKGSMLVHPALVKIKMVYARPWQKDLGVVTTFTVQTVPQKLK